MIHMFCFVARRPDLTPEAFVEHWRERHGPLIHDLPGLARHVVYYEQNPRLPADYDREGAPAFDGLAHQVFGRHEDFIGFVTEPDYPEHVRADEQRFLDMGNLAFLLTEEPRVLVDGDRSAAGVKLVSFIRRKRGVSREAFHSWWAEERAALMQNDPDLYDSVIAHFQYKRTERDYERDVGEGWDGAVEQWFPSLELFHAYGAKLAAKDALGAADESLLDTGATCWMLTHDTNVVIDRT